MVFIKLTAQEKHTWNDSKYGIQANDIAMAEAETEKTPVFRPRRHWSVSETIQRGSNSVVIFNTPVKNYENTDISPICYASVIYEMKKSSDQKLLWKFCPSL